MPRAVCMHANHTGQSNQPVHGVSKAAGCESQLFAVRAMHQIISVKNGQNHMHSDFRTGFLNNGASPGLLLIVESNGPGRGRKGKRAWTRWTWTHSTSTTATAPPPPLPLSGAPSATPAAAAHPACASALTFPPPLSPPP